MIAAIVTPVGVRSIAMMRACLVSGRDTALGDEATVQIAIVVITGIVSIRAGLFEILIMDFPLRRGHPKRRHPSWPSA
jgi:hypothetical protein